MSNDEQEYNTIDGMIYKESFYLKEISVSENGFCILMENEYGNIYQIKWPEWVKSYRKSEESNRLLLINELDEVGLLGNRIIECKRSNYVKWLNSETYDAGIIGDVRHMIILSSHDIVDVICEDLPKITIIEP